MSYVSQSSFDKFVNLFGEKLDKIIASQVEFSSKLDSISAEVVSLKSDATTRDSRIVELESTLEEQKLKSEALEKRLLAFEVKDRKLNLLVHGLPEEKSNETPEANVKNLFANKLGIDEPVMITKCYRITSRSANITDSRQRKSKQKQVKPLLVSLGSENEIQAIMSNVGKLKASGIVICTDLPPELNIRRSELLAKAREMKMKGEITSSRVRQKGIDIWLEIKGSASSSWSSVRIS